MTKISNDDTLFESLPLLPVSELMILPGMVVPLKLKTKRDKELIERAFYHGRVFGIVQPSYTKQNLVEKIGISVKIESFQEVKQNNDTIFDIKIVGLSRFEIIDVNLSQDVFLIAKISFDKFTNDLTPPPLPKFDRTLFIKEIYNLFKRLDIQLDLASLHKMNDYKLIDTFAMSCPFTPNQRQRLLEAVDINDRASVMIEFFEMDFGHFEPKKGFNL